MEETKNIALVAHDNRKKDLIEWIDLISSSLIGQKYAPVLKDYESYIKRELSLD